jgi:hypothetical protein
MLEKKNNSKEEEGKQGDRENDRLTHSTGM